ncbi:MAG: hypothetical protein JW751_12645 [Polyangiaceae bacterium]|nr:hypothetical protein [Polyangiaceae bacterium]
MSRTSNTVLGSIIAIALCMAQRAHAQGVDEFGPYGELERGRQLSSPQRFAFEFRVGPYRPNVDDGLAANPYRETFGTKQRYLFGFELDWQVLRIPWVGSFGPGVGVNSFTAKAKAPLVGSTRRSGEETKLRILPAYLVGVLRIDVLAQKTVVPLAAYGKLGVGAARWWASGEDHLERADGVVGKDTSYGPHGAVGAMFLLNALDRGGALEMDAITGINNAYLLAEYQFSRLDGFGGDDMDVGDNTWLVGVALEF